MSPGIRPATAARSRLRPAKSGFFDAQHGSTSSTGSILAPRASGKQEFRDEHI
jgi:hypothetical protein